MTDRQQLPPWGLRARTICRGAGWCLFMGFVIKWSVNLIDWLIDADLNDALRDAPTSVKVAAMAYVLGAVALGLLAGVAWLGSAVVAGYREPKSGKE